MTIGPEDYFYREKDEDHSIFFIEQGEVELVVDRKYRSTVLGHTYEG